MSQSSALELRSLEGIDWAPLAAAFNAGFSGYAVPMAFTAQTLAAMQLRRGYDASASVGAFDRDGQIVGFALTCRDGDRLYNSGTGVIPAHRGAGLARRLVAHVISRHAAAVSAYVLEVIDSNAPAIELYRKLGFVETRGLQCWRSEASSVAALTELSSGDFERFLAVAASERELEPSWQNTLASIGRATEPYAVYGDPSGEGLVVVFPSNGDVPFLHVRASSRRRGLGAHLLAGAAAHVGKPLRLINLDERVASVSAFLASTGATRTLRQLEMRYIADKVVAISSLNPPNTSA